MRVAFLIAALIPVVCEAKGERERIAVLAARVRYGLSQRPQMPDQPPNIELRNLRSTLDTTHEPIDPIESNLKQMLDDQSQSIADLESRRSSLEVQNADLSRAVESLTRELIAIKAQATNMVGGDAASPPSPPGVAAGVASPGYSLRLTEPVTASTPVSQYKAVIFTAENVYGRGWCVNCPGVLARFGHGNGQVSIEHSQDLAPGSQVYPAFRWRDGTGKWRQPTDEQGQYRQPKDINELRAWIESTGPQTLTATATAMGGTIQTRGGIHRILSLWHENLGADTSISLRWDRTGLQSLSATRLMHGEAWTPAMVTGRFGHVSLVTTSTKLPLGLKDVGFNYKILGNGKYQFDPDPLTLTLLDSSVRAHSPRAFATGEQTVAALDPISMGWGVYSLATAIYQLLNPQVDVGLGGTVELSAKLTGSEKLVVTFSECPSIHISAWFRFDLDVERLEITATNVHVAFKPQPNNWIKVDSRDFAVNDIESP